VSWWRWSPRYGCGGFLPRNAGLFLRCRGRRRRAIAAARQAQPRSNLGWASANRACFARGGLVGGLPREVGFLLALASFLFVLATLALAALPPQPPVGTATAPTTRAAAPASSGPHSLC